MDTIVYLLKYGFLAVLTVEAVLVGRALIRLALDKAHAFDTLSAGDAQTPQE